MLLNFQLLETLREISTDFIDTTIENGRINLTLIKKKEENPKTSFEMDLSKYLAILPIQSHRNAWI